MDSMNAWALSNLVVYGLPILLLVTYFGSLGIPFPITPFIIAAGAFTRTGLIDWRLALAACLIGSSLADNSEYLLGRLAGRWLTRRFKSKLVWQRAQGTINRQGGWAILLTRFWLMPLAPAINLIAGSRYSYGRFLFFDLTGELLWVLLYGGLGYIFMEQWSLVSQIISGLGGLSLAVVVFIAGAYLLVHWRRNRKNQVHSME